MNRAFFFLVACGVVVAAVNCGGTASSEERGCPCSDGLVCCEAASICLPPGAACPAPAPPLGADAAPDQGQPDATSPSCGPLPVEPPPADAGAPDSGGAQDGGALSRCPSTVPITAAEIDARAAWKPPAAPQNVCGQKEINALKSAFKSSSNGLAFTDIQAALGAACSACVFSSSTASNWQLFVGDAAGRIDNGLASCMTQERGGACGPSYGAVCGKARFRVEGCLDLACPGDECSDGSGVTGCYAKASKGACKPVLDAYAVACPDEPKLIDACENPLQQIAASCSGGPGHGLDTTL